MKPLASSSSRERILSRIRQGLSIPTPSPFPNTVVPESYFVQSDEDPAVVFAEQFMELQGKFVYCPTLDTLHQQLHQLVQSKGWASLYWNDAQIDAMLQPLNWSSSQHLADCDASITGCEFLVARTGSILLSSGSGGNRTTSIYAPIHITIAYTHQLVNDLPELFDVLTRRYGNQLPSFISLASGPSRTADIEKTLVTGIHGPKEIYCFLLESSSDTGND
jgi:L-lactate dehydrogenase complex protein LldG